MFISLLSKRLIRNLLAIGGYHKEQQTDLVKKEQEAFLLVVFSEMNEHLRATDEKSILVGGSFLALTSIIAVLLTDKLSSISWGLYMVSFTLLLVGYCLILLQVWYRKWKEHYLSVCQYIADYYHLPEEFLPYWLRKPQIGAKRRFSADMLVFVASLVVELIVFTYFVYLLVNLLLLEKLAFLFNIIIFTTAAVVLIISVFVGILLLRKMIA